MYSPVIFQIGTVESYKFRASLCGIWIVSTSVAETIVSLFSSIRYFFFSGIAREGGVDGMGVF